jgi:hypothetical protein
VKFDMEAIDSGHLDMQDILDTVKNEILKEWLYVFWLFIWYWKNH